MSILNPTLKERSIATRVGLAATSLLLLVTLGTREVIASAKSLLNQTVPTATNTSTPSPIESSATPVNDSNGSGSRLVFLSMIMGPQPEIMPESSPLPGQPENVCIGFEYIDGGYDINGNPVTSYLTTTLRIGQIPDGDHRHSVSTMSSYNIGDQSVGGSSGSIGAPLSISIPEEYVPAGNLGISYSHSIVIGDDRDPEHPKDYRFGGIYSPQFGLYNVKADYENYSLFAGQESVVRACEGSYYRVDPRVVSQEPAPNPYLMTATPASIQVISATPTSTPTATVTPTATPTPEN
jgi:hypothetical protein